MRAALQFLMRHMVKRAVMRSPIKRALALADLERAQAMIYKLVVNGLMEEPSGGKTKPGEFVVVPGEPERSPLPGLYLTLCMSGVRVEADGEADGQEGEQLAQTPITTSPSASSTTSFMSSSLEDTTTATTPVTDTETVPASESPGVMPLSLLRWDRSPSAFSPLRVAESPSLFHRLCAATGKCSPATRRPAWFPPVGPRLLPSPLCPRLLLMKWAGGRASPRRTPRPTGPRTAQEPVSVSHEEPASSAVGEEDTLPLICAAQATRKAAASSLALIYQPYLRQKTFFRLGFCQSGRELLRSHLSLFGLFFGVSISDFLTWFLSFCVFLFFEQSCPFFQGECWFFHQYLMAEHVTEDQF